MLVRDFQGSWKRQRIYFVVFNRNLVLPSLSLLWNYEERMAFNKFGFTDVPSKSCVTKTVNMCLIFIVSQYKCGLFPLAPVFTSPALCLTFLQNSGIFSEIFLYYMAVYFFMSVFHFWIMTNFISCWYLFIPSTSYMKGQYFCSRFSMKAVLVIPISVHFAATWQQHSWEFTHALNRT